MEQRLRFDTSENLKKLREEDFLRRDPSERFSIFLQMVEEFSIFNTKTKKKNNNFILERDNEV